MSNGQPQVSTMLPEQLDAAGLIDDFDAVVTEVRLIPHKFGGMANYRLFGRVKMQLGDGTIHVEYYSAGDLKHWIPSMDGATKVDLDGDDIEAMVGIYAIKVGTQDTVPKGTNWANYLTALIDAGFPKADFKASVNFFEGIYAHFNRIAQPDRPGLDQPSDKKATYLVVTEIHRKAAPVPVTSVEQVAAPSVADVVAPTVVAPAETTAASTVLASAPAGNADLDESLVAFVLSSIAAAPGQILQKTKLPPLAAKHYTGSASLGPAIMRVGQVEFLSSNPAWQYNADTGDLSLG